MGAIIGVSVVLGLLCLGLIIVVIVLLVILCCCEKRPNSTTPTKKNKVYKFDRMYCNIFSRVGDRNHKLIFINWQFIELTLIILFLNLYIV